MKKTRSSAPNLSVFSPVYKTGPRDPFFRLLLRRMDRHTPDRLRSLMIQILMNTTAEAFEEEPKRIWNLPAARARQEYAVCTQKWSLKKDADPRRIYRTAYKLGSRIRAISGFTQTEDLQRLVFWLYRMIGISMSGQLPGNITVSACFFSIYYSPAQCRLMSAMDAGVIAGIFSGGKLEFTERITEGCQNCRACFRKDTAPQGRQPQE